VLLMVAAANVAVSDTAPPAQKIEPVLVNTKEAMTRTPGDYPAEALDKGIGGYVLVQFTLPDDGHPTQSVVVMSEPKGVFENVALAKVQTMQFALPEQWVAEHPNRRHELVFIYYVWGASWPEVPPFDGRAITLIGRRGDP